MGVGAAGWRESDFLYKRSKYDFFFWGGGGGEASDFVDKLAKKPNLTELGGLQTWGKCIFWQTPNLIFWRGVGAGGGGGGKGQWIYKDQSKSELFWRGWGGGEGGWIFFWQGNPNLKKIGVGGAGGKWIVLTN